MAGNIIGKNSCATHLHHIGSGAEAWNEFRNRYHRFAARRDCCLARGIRRSGGFWSICLRMVRHTSLSHLVMTAHAGTHIDAPLHVVEGGESVGWTLGYLSARVVLRCTKKTVTLTVRISGG